MADLDPGNLFTFVCPITNALMEEPVVAGDGNTYDKKAILNWFADSSKLHFPITTPLKSICSTKLLPNKKVAKAIKVYREQQDVIIDRKIAAVMTSRTRRAQIGGAAATDDPKPLSESPKSLAELGAMFATLDGLRELLAESLDGWQPPSIVVLGQVCFF